MAENRKNRVFTMLSVVVLMSVVAVAVLMQDAIAGKTIDEVVKDWSMVSEAELNKKEYKGLRKELDRDSAGMIRAEIARIKKEGAPVTLEELDGPTIADSINGAVVYQKAFDLMPQRDDKETAFIGRATSSRDPIKTDEEWNELRKVLAKYDGAVPLIEKAAALPECRFSAGWVKLGPMEAVYPQLVPVKRMSFVLSAKAVLSARDGKMDEAVRYLGLCLRLGNAVKYNPTIIQSTIGVLNVNCYLWALRDIMKMDCLNADQMQRLCEQLATINLADLPLKVLQVERAQAIAVFDGVREKGPDWMDSEQGETTPEPFEITQMHIKRCYADELYYLQRTRDYLIGAKMPYRDLMKAANKYREWTEKSPSYVVISAIWLVPPDSIVRMRDRCEASINGTRIALALRIYQKKNGNLPAKLADLGVKLPVDPFSGKAFVYKQIGSGYLLYSIGANLKDDRGKEPGPDDDVVKVGDVVWKAE